MKKLAFFVIIITSMNANIFADYTYNKYEKVKSRYYLNKLFSNKVERPQELNNKPEPIVAQPRKRKKIKFEGGDQRYDNSVSYTSLMDYSSSRKSKRNLFIDDSDLDDEISEPVVKTTKKAKGRLVNVIRMARRLLGQSYRRFNTGNRSFNGDCSGFIAYIYGRNNFNLFKNATFSSSLTRSIYSSMKARNLTHKRKLPNPGDIVFFHNSYDRNRDRRANDWYSHLGVVESVKSNGDIVFIHYLNKRRGITRDKMNLYSPNSTKRNSYLRNRYRYPHPQGRYLTGQLFAGFASLK